MIEFKLKFQKAILFTDIHPSKGVGIDIFPSMVNAAKEKYPEYEFYVMDAENITINEEFDFVLISDTSSTEDLPKFYEAISTGKGEFINGSRLQN